MSIQKGNAETNNVSGGILIILVRKVHYYRGYVIWDSYTSDVNKGFVNFCTCFFINFHTLELRVG